MKKVSALLLSILLICLGGCTVPQNDYSSEFADIYEQNTAFADSVISRIDEDINRRENAGEITVITEEEVYITDEKSSFESADTGKQNTVLDTDLTDKEIQKITPSDINTKGDKPLYYTYLTDTQKQIYRYMKTAAQEMTVGLFSIGAVKNSEDRFTDITVAFRALSADNPQIFWLPSSYLLSPDGSSVAFSYSEKGADYTKTPQQKSQAEIQLTTTVNNLAAQANQLSSRFEKEVFFHDWLCENVVYKDDGTDDAYTAYGALINGAAVCEGYSRAMQLLCDSVGIPCTVVYGSSRGVGHMWNIVNPGDGWCHLDVTWDDDEKYNITRHAYFNLTDTQILSDHDIFEVVKPNRYYIGDDDFNIYLYECSSDKYNYFTKKNLIFGDDYAANAQIVISAAQSGNSVTEVFYSGDEYQSFLTQVNIALLQSGSNIGIRDYSYLSSSLVLWW